jgi:hypothetical protein
LVLQDTPMTPSIHRQLPSAPVAQWQTRPPPGPHAGGFDPIGTQPVQLPPRAVADAAAAFATKLSITGATHAEPPTTAPALMSFRRVMAELAVRSL